MPGAETQMTIEEIQPFEASEEIAGGDVVLIDTREPHEYQEAHLENGKLVPPGLLGDEIEAAAPDKSRPHDPLLPLRQPLGARRRAAAAARLRRMSPRWRAASSPGRSRGSRSSPPRG